MTKQIKVLGTGCCSNCSQLHKTISQVAQEMQADVVITKSDDIMEIVAAGVMSTPAVVIDGKVVHAGGMPSIEDIKQWL